MSRRRKRSKKWVSRLIILILLVVAGIIVYLVWDGYFNNEKEDTPTPSQVSTQATEEEQEVVVEDEEEPAESEEKKVKQYEGEDPNKSEELSGVVTYAGVVDGKIMIRANIDQYLEGGTCKLSLSKNGQVAYEETVSITDSASTSTCKGFDITATKLSSGDYNIVIKIESNSKTGTIRGVVSV